MNGVSTNGQTKLKISSTTAIFDSGTSLIAVPEADFNTTISGNPDFYMLNKPNSFGQIIGSCGTLSIMPNITITINNVRYNITRMLKKLYFISINNNIASEYYVPISRFLSYSNNQCVMIVYSAGVSNAFNKFLCHESLIYPYTII